MDERVIQNAFNRIKITISNIKDNNLKEYLLEIIEAEKSLIFKDKGAKVELYN